MKFTRALLFVALALLLALGAIACSLLTTPQSEALETKIQNYLAEKYPDLDFEIRGYTQDTYTSGKYIFQVFCKNTEVDFVVYQSSFLITDSYTVTYANLVMEKKFIAFFGKELMTTYIQSVQWLDLYADGSTGYKFRDVDLTQLPASVSSVKSIYKMELFANNTEDVLQSIALISKKLNKSDISCDEITFEWKQNDYTINFTTNTYSLTTATEEELLGFLSYVDAARQSDEIVRISYVSRTKYAELFLNDIENPQNIPGFNHEPDERSDEEITDPSESSEATEATESPVTQEVFV